MKKIAIIVPAYNEEKSIAEVVNGIKSLSINDIYKIDVIVINDCSTDKTSEIASGLDCILINLPLNLGIGGAMQTGFKYAMKRDYDYAIQVDGDGQHPAKEIPRLIKAMEDYNADVVIGSRFLENEGFRSTLTRRIGINFFKFIIKFLTGKLITDSTSGFRILNRKALEIVNKYYPDEYPEPESIILYSYNKLNIIETPVVMVERQGGKSSIGSISGIYYMIKVSLGIIFTMIRTKRS
ncbi:MAG: glycosyltransferase family 2 protein [Bacteroidota bacterium]|nr:glycosyltransferase family 2 protein [Bacteroidota bacterium]